MRQKNIPSLLQIMACHLIGAKPLSETTLPYCQLHPKEHISTKFYLKLKSFHSWKCIWTCRQWNGGHFVSVSMSWRKATYEFSVQVALWTTKCVKLELCFKSQLHSMAHQRRHASGSPLNWLNSWYNIIDVLNIQRMSNFVVFCCGLMTKTYDTTLSYKDHHAHDIPTWKCLL